MKLRILLIAVLFFGFSYAQESLSAEEQDKREKNIQAGNPFKKFGYKPKIATLSKGKYLEWHDLDTIVRIGSFLYHVKQKQLWAYEPLKPEDKGTLSPEISSRWISPDPLMEEFPEWSPYNFTLNNPIRFIDPDGRMAVDIMRDNPVFGSDGSYRGNTIEGYTGEVIIYDGDKDFSKISKDELLKEGGRKLSNFEFNSQTNRNKIESHIVNYNLNDGLNRNKNINIVSSEPANYLYKATGDKSNLEVTRGVSKHGKSVADIYYEPTVENIRNVVNLHEIGGHILEGIKYPNEHYKAVLKQIYHPQFQNTTQQFQGKTLRTLYELNPYHVLQTPKLHRLYYEVGRPYWNEFNKR